MQQTFFVGIGAQKAGTLWLYNYVQSNPDSCLSSMKEMHYFNAFTGDRNERTLRRIAGHRQEAMALGWKQAVYWSGLKRYNGYSMRQHLALLDDYKVLMSRDRIDVDGYVELLRRHAGQARVFGEITPAYAILSKEQLSSLYNAFPQTRLIFLMRDPLKRLWSNARMKSRMTGHSDLEATSALLRSMNAGKYPNVIARSDYRATIQRLDETVPREHVHYEFSESLFGQSEIAEAARNQICDFLGMARYAPASVQKVSNPGNPLAIPDHLAREALIWLRPQYDYVGEKFGQLPEAWERSLSKYG